MSSLGNEANSNKVAADILCEFLEIAFNAVLYIRDLYPAAVFQLKKKYNVPVQMCRHPEVCDYIQQLLESIKPLLQSGRIRKVALVVIGDRRRHQTPLEQYVFELAPPTKSKDSDVGLVRLEQSLRGFLLKLNTCDAVLEHRTSHDSSWTVHLYTTDDAVIDMQETCIIEDFHWVEADETELQIEQPSLIPLKAMDSHVIKMQLYIEESAVNK